jgi:hypothetical protein
MARAFAERRNAKKANKIEGFEIWRLAGSCRFGVNEARTFSKSDTPLTQRCSREVLHVQTPN